METKNNKEEAISKEELDARVRVFLDRIKKHRESLKPTPQRRMGTRRLSKTSENHSGRNSKKDESNIRNKEGTGKKCQQ